MDDCHRSCGIGHHREVKCVERALERAQSVNLPTCVRLILTDAAPEEAFAAIARRCAVMFAGRTILANRTRRRHNIVDYVVAVGVVLWLLQPIIIFVQKCGLGCSNICNICNKSIETIA